MKITNTFLMVLVGTINYGLWKVNIAFGLGCLIMFAGFYLYNSYYVVVATYNLTKKTYAVGKAVYNWLSPVAVKTGTNVVKMFNRKVA